MFGKDDIKRLAAMLKSLDRSEAELSSRYGDMVKGSIRSVNFRNAEAIRRILCEINKVVKT